MVQRGHFEDAFFAELKAGHLQHDAHEFDYVDAADEEQERFLFDQDGDGAHGAAEAERARIAAAQTTPPPAAAPVSRAPASGANCRADVASAASTVTVYFRIASAAVEPASQDALTRLASTIRTCPSARVRIEGHTDGDAANTDNQKLSERRAEAVMRALLKAGVAPEQLTAVGFGASRPIAPNTSNDNKRKNRRIELNVDPS